MPKLQSIHADRSPSPPTPLPPGERGDSAPERVRLPLSRSGRGSWGVRVERQWIPYVNSIGARQLRAVFAALLLIPLLSGCLLISGEQTMIGPLAGTGRLSTMFVSAEGSEERTVTVSDANADLHAIVLITLDTGDLQVDLLQPDGALAFAVSNQPSIKVIRSGAVRSDANGAVRYRVSARSARHGEYQIFFLP